MLCSTYLGGGVTANLWDVAVDRDGCVYACGTTRDGFPVAGAYQPVYGGDWSDVFVSKFDSTGSALIYSTYLGGEGVDYAYSLEPESDGSIYLVGNTASYDFPIVNPYQSPGSGIFVTRIGFTTSTTRS